MEHFIFSLSICSLCILFLELLQEVHQSLNALLGHGVVDGSAHTAYASVALDVNETALCSFLNELIVKLGVAFQCKGGSRENNGSAFCYSRLFEYISLSVNSLDSAYLSASLEATDADNPLNRLKSTPINNLTPHCFAKLTPAGFSL